jgi:hypothetical protein
MNAFARVKADRIPAACSVPAGSMAASALTRSRMDLSSRTSRACGGPVLSSYSTS